MVNLYALLTVLPCMDPGFEVSLETFIVSVVARYREEFVLRSDPAT